MLFISTNDCVDFTSVSLSFMPSDIIFHSSKPNGLLAYDKATKTVSNLLEWISYMQ